MVSVPLTRYAVANGAHIAYQVCGDSDHDVVFVSNWATNVEAMWDHPTIWGRG